MFTGMSMQLNGTVMRALAGGWPQLVASVADGETGPT